jgi:hypothetical protein
MLPLYVCYVSNDCTSVRQFPCLELSVREMSRGCVTSAARWMSCGGGATSPLKSSAHLRHVIRVATLRIFTVCDKWDIDNRGLQKATIAIPVNLQIQTPLLWNITRYVWLELWTSKILVKTVCRWHFIKQQTVFIKTRSFIAISTKYCQEMLSF